MKPTHILPTSLMGTVTRTRLLSAAFCLSLCGLGVTAGAQKLAQVASANRPVVIDNDHRTNDVPGFVAKGFVIPFAGHYPQGYNSDTAYVVRYTGTSAAEIAAETRAKGAEARWSFGGLTAGTYDVFATYGAGGDFTTAAPYVLQGDAKPVIVDQTKAPADETIDGRGWKLLGTVTIKNNESITVALKAGPTKITMADAVMVRKKDTVVSGPNCPIPSCAAPLAGCSYVPDATVGANGCPANPCGILQCEPTRPAAPACGNAIVETGEQCDDGNLRPGDACSPTCQLARCGDGIVNAGETCDMGGQNGAPQGTYMCTAQCAWAYCGDAIVQRDLGEQCDGGADCARDCKIVPKVACNDGKDNDGDGTIDMNDKGCLLPQGTTEEGAADIAAVFTNVSIETAVNRAFELRADFVNNGPDRMSQPISVEITFPRGFEVDMSRWNNLCKKVDDADSQRVICTTEQHSSNNNGAANLTMKYMANESVQPGSYAFDVRASTAQKDPNPDNNAVKIIVKVIGLPNTCTDTDGGNKPDVAGQVTAGTQVGIDLCTNEGGPNGVFEYYCDANNAMQRVTATCQYGCMAGACKPKPVVTTQCTSPAATGAAGQNQAMTLDVNGDGTVNQLDLTSQISYYNTRQPVAGMRYDVDGSGAFDVQDILYVINHVRCLQQNPPTTPEPGATIKLTGASLSCIAGASQLNLAYVSTGMSGGKAQLFSAEGTALTQATFNLNASSVSVSPPPAGVVAGTQVKVCAGTVCSGTFAVTGAACAPVETVKLTSVVVATENGVQVGKVTYEKNFDTCAHLTDTSYRVLHKQNHFCQNAGTVTVPLSAGLAIKEGDKVYLCHGNKKGSVCSALTTVTKAVAPADSVSLAGVAMSCRDGKDYVTVNYKKNFATCVHMKTPGNVNYGTQNHFCNNEGPVLVEASKLMNPASGIIAVGSQVKLCHGNNGSVCSSLVPVTGTACGVASNAKLNIAVKSIGSTDTAVKNEKNITLLRFEAGATDGGVLLTDIVARASAGSPLNAQNYTLWLDSDGDGASDTILQKGVSTQSNLVTFDSIVGGGVAIDEGSIVTMEIRADVASSLVDNALQLELATAAPNYVRAETLNDGTSLVGIETNGACAGTCAINVTTTRSKTFTLVNQGDLFVILDSTPTRSRQLLGGALSEPVMRLQFRAQNENVIPTMIRLVSVGGRATSVDRLELVREGETTSFAIATTAACGDIYSTGFEGLVTRTFCASLQNGQLVVPNGQTVKVLVKTRLKTDEQGGLSNEPIQFAMDDFGEHNGGFIGTLLSQTQNRFSFVEARGEQSSSNLLINDNDTFPDGEVYIGTDVPGVNKVIRSAKHVSALSKITSITNANPDADNTNVPTGVSPIGQFRFTAATNANTLNGLNKASIQKLAFIVSTTNVSLDQNSFKLYNKADSSSKAACTVTGGGGSNGTGGGSSTSWSYFVECANPEASGVDASLDSGASSVFVLETNVLNAKTSTAASSLQVSFGNFSLPFQPTSDVEWLDKDAGAVGAGTSTSSRFTWIEYPDTVIRSTAYRS